MMYVLFAPIANLKNNRMNEFSFEVFTSASNGFFMFWATYCDVRLLVWIT